MKRSVKYDDETLSLVMDVRLMVGDDWERITVEDAKKSKQERDDLCLLYTSPSPRDRQKSRMPSSA